MRRVTLPARLFTPYSDTRVHSEMAVPWNGRTGGREVRAETGVKQADTAEAEVRAEGANVGRDAKQDEDAAAKTAADAELARALAMAGGL